MNGRVELTSEYGRGTTFKIFVPLAKAPLEDPEDAPDAVVSPAASSASASTNGIAGETREPRRAQDVRVLLAEDNKLIREIVTRTLRGMKVSRQPAFAYVSRLALLNQLVCSDSRDPSSTSMPCKMATSVSLSSRRKTTMSSSWT